VIRDSIASLVVLLSDSTWSLAATASVHMLAALFIIGSLSHRSTVCSFVSY